VCTLAKQILQNSAGKDNSVCLPAQQGIALMQVDRNGEADLYEAQSQAMCFLCSLDAVNNEQAAGSALQCPHIQQGFQQSPRGAHSSKQGRPHLSVRLPRHTDHNVPEQREVADELRCSLKEWPCHQHSSLSCNNQQQTTSQVWGL